MATVSSIGIGSGIDANSIITQLMAVEKQPLTALQTKATALQTQLSTYGKLQSDVSALRDAAAALTNNSTWGATTGSSSDSVAVGITTGTSTTAGNYTVNMTQLAQGQSNMSKSYASADSLVGEGTLHITLGTWGTGNSFTAAGSTIDITAGPPAQSLAQLRDKINSSGAGITASVLTDASGSRLVFHSSNTGAANGFKITASDTDGNNTDGLGLSALAYDPSAGILTMAQALAAVNAQFTLNGIAVSSATNTPTNVVDGISLSLNKVTSTPVTLSAAQDNTSIRKAVDTFVSAYNDLNKLLGDQTKYDSANTKHDNLQGDASAISLRAQIRTALTATTGASSTFTRVSDIGLDVQTDGSIKVNDTKITSAITNLSELKKFFSNTDTVTTSNNGIATTLRNTASTVLGVDGTLYSRKASLQKSIDYNNTQQDAMNTRIAATEKRMRAQYTALDAQMGQLQGLQSYVTQQINQYNKTSK